MTVGDVIWLYTHTHQTHREDSKPPWISKPKQIFTHEYSHILIPGLVKVGTIKEGSLCYKH